MTFTTASVLGMLGAPLLSMLVGIVTKSSTPSAVKTYLLLFLSAVYGVMEEWLTAPQFDYRAAILKVVVAFIVAVNTHSGFSKPVGLTDYLQNAVGPKDNPDGDQQYVPPEPKMAAPTPVVRPSPLSTEPLGDDGTYGGRHYKRT